MISVIYGSSRVNKMIKSMNNCEKSSYFFTQYYLLVAFFNYMSVILLNSVLQALGIG